MLIETIIAPKTGLGGDYSFEPGTLEVRKNEHGVTGLFTKVAVPKGAVILSVSADNGNMSRERAFAEAKPLLAKLGDDQFQLEQEFILAAALYTRHEADKDRKTDILFSDEDLAEAYKGAPMSALYSTAQATLLSKNDAVGYKRCKRTEHLIDRLGVDAHTFRFFLAYASSRSWSDYGVIPVMDMLNSSYGASANCCFEADPQRFKYVALRDIIIGEELTFEYNDSDAIITWMRFGYVDPMRPTRALLQLNLDDVARATFETFLINTLGLPGQAVDSAGKFDAGHFDFVLTYPGTMPTPEGQAEEVKSAINSFVKARTFMRAFVLSRFDELHGGTSLADVLSDANLFGADIETEVIQTMLDGLSAARMCQRGRTRAFTETEVGRDIDVAPFEQMIEGTYDAWDITLRKIRSVLGGEEVLLMDDATPSVEAELLRKYSENFNAEEDALLEYA